MLGNILLFIVSFCTFISYFPQIVKLIKSKKSRNLSIQSWFLFVVSSFSYTLYAILVSKDGMLIFETSLELLFCLMTLILTIIYKNN